MEKQIILIPSDSMDNNQKEGRNEHGLIRMAKVARDILDPSDSGMTLEGIKSTQKLETFKAFSADVKAARKMMVDGQLFDEHDLSNTCFVSTQTFKKLGGKGETLVLDLNTGIFKKLLIGTDPELLLMEDGVVRHADCVPGFSKNSKFGNDGAMAELRPDPSFTPEGLIVNMKKLLHDDKLIANVTNYDWISSCYFENGDRDYPVGTHIHIDNPKKIGLMDTEERMRLFAVTNKIIDELLTIPLIRLDGADGHKRRARCKMSSHNNYNKGKYGKGYGFFGEWRSCNGHLEHRSISGLVIANPDICTAVFGTAKAIVEAVYKETLKNGLKREFILPGKFSKIGIYKDTFDQWDKIPLAQSLSCTTASGTISAAMNKSCRTDVSRKSITEWLAKIRKLPTYSTYSENIESLGSVLSSSAKVLNGYSNANMKKTWKD